MSKNRHPLATEGEAAPAWGPLTVDRHSGTAESEAMGARSLLFDMPYGATAPRLINPLIGLHNLVARAGPDAGYTMEVTLLDAPDHRLIRSGLVLAHRVLDGRGEWYLSAADWSPELPVELIVPMGQSEMPERFDDLIKPFRRMATLGPVAALSCDRREFALRNDTGTTLATLRDDLVTIRRNGLITARFREVRVVPQEPGLSPQQRSWLRDTLIDAGGTPVREFHRLSSRLGAPATGLSDFPAPQPVDPGRPLEAFVSVMLATRLRALVQADLQVREGVAEAAEALARQARLLQYELAGISAALAPEWLEDLDDELDWIAEAAEACCGADRSDPAGLLMRLRGSRYLSMLDRLVNAARAPRLGDSSGLSAYETVRILLDTSLTRLRRAGNRLAKNDTAAAWERAHQAADHLSEVLYVAAWIEPGLAGRLRRVVIKAERMIDRAYQHRRRAEEAATDLDLLSPVDAFARGRDHERELMRQAVAHRKFQRRWEKLAAKLQHDADGSKPGPSR